MHFGANDSARNRTNQQMNAKNVNLFDFGASLRAVIGDRLRAERERLGIKAESFEDLGPGFSKRTIYDWESGRSSPKAEFFALAGTRGIDITYVLTGERNFAQGGAPDTSYRTLSGPAPAPDNEDDVFHVPVMATTASMGCGKDQLDTDLVVRDVRFSKKWLERNAPHSRLEALRLIGSDGLSMQGTINDGDLSLVDTDVRTTDIPGVYVLVVAGLTFIKRVSIKLDGTKVVSSDNPDDQLTEVLRGGEQLDVRGMVVYGWNGRRF